MAKFSEALALALATEGMTFPEGFGDSLQAAYDEDMAEVNDLSASKIAALETQAGDANTLAADLKIKLYDLMNAERVSSDTDLQDGIDPEARETFEGDEDAEAPDIDSFFTTETDNEDKE